MPTPNLFFQLRQSGFLLLTALIWGCSFVAQSIGMDHVEPFTFTTFRMALGVLCLLPFVIFSRKRLAQNNPNAAAERRSGKYTRNLILGGFLCGLCLFGGEALQQFGFVYDTEVGKSGFLTALYIVFVPLIGLLLGKRVAPTIWGAVALAVFGLWFLCIPAEGFSIATGDLYVLSCAVVFSLHILVISHFVTRVDGIELSMMQFFCGSLIACIAMLTTETPTLTGLEAALPAILWAGIMSNGIAYTLQIVGQRGMNDTVASLILSLESVFSVLAGWLVLGEVLSMREGLGCVLMTVAVILAQLPSRKTKN